MAVGDLIIMRYCVVVLDATSFHGGPKSFLLKPECNMFIKGNTESFEVVPLFAKLVTFTHCSGWT